MVATLLRAFKNVLGLGLLEDHSNAHRDSKFQKFNMEKFHELQYYVYMYFHIHVGG